MNYRHAEATGTDISATGPLLSLRTEGRDVSVFVSASVSSDFDLEVDFGDGTWVTWQSYSATASIADTVSIHAERVRVTNTTAQTTGDTADVRLGAE